MNWWRKLSNHIGKGTRSKRAAGSHVHSKRNKRAANKYVRRRAACTRELDTFAYDYHLDIPDEIKETDSE